jgi:hypothetical protein
MDIPRKVKRKIDKTNTGKWHFYRGYARSKWGRERTSKEVEKLRKSGYEVEVREGRNLLSIYVFVKDSKELNKFYRFVTY